MIKVLPWYKVPQSQLLELLPSMKWLKHGENTSPAADTAALMLYVALLFMHDVEGDKEHEIHVAQSSYEALGNATGLSRSLIRQGLARLIALGVICPEGSNQRRRYVLTWATGSWIKLPCQAIVSKDKSNGPFKNFVLRSKYDLHAMKLYLYLACVRGRSVVYSVASYETIFQKTGIPEKDTRRAISMLLSSGLLKNVGREPTIGSNSYGPNRYYLAGCEAFTDRRTTTGDSEGVMTSLEF